MSETPRNAIEQRISDRIMLYASLRHPNWMNQFTVEDIIREELEQTLRLVRNATEAECSCGGRAVGDAEACQACRIYHRIFDPETERKIEAGTGDGRE